MNLDAQMIVSIFEANEDFSRVMHLADIHGRVVILKNTQGLLTPITVRPLPNDEYEVISGHRRLHACQKAGIETVPALIYALDRDAAAIALVDSNLHREKILPSERAFAYKLKAEALKHQGQRTDLTSVQVAPKWATEQIAETAGTSKDTIKKVHSTY